MKITIILNGENAEKLKELTAKNAIIKRANIYQYLMIEAIKSFEGKNFAHEITATPEETPAPVLNDFERIHKPKAAKTAPKRPSRKAVKK